MDRLTLRERWQKGLAVRSQSSHGICLTPWLDMIENGELSKEESQKAISSLLKGSQLLFGKKIDSTP